MDDRTVKWIAALAALGGLYWIFDRKSREVRVGAFTHRERKHLHESENDWDKPAVGFEMRHGQAPWRWPHHEPRRWEPWPSWRVELQPRPQPRRYFPVMPERHYYPVRRPRVQVQEGYAPEMDIQPYEIPTPPPAPPPYAAPAPPPAPPQYAAPAPSPAPPQYAAPAPQSYAAPAPPPAPLEAMPYEQAADVPHGIQPLPPPPPHAPPAHVPVHVPAPPHPQAPPAAPPQSPPQGAGAPTSPWWQSPPLLADQQHMSPEIRGAFEAMSPESQQSLAWQSLTTGRSMEEILRSGG